MTRQSRILNRAGPLLVAILAIGFLFRSISLDLKPIHFDEGINGNFVREMWRTGYYHYNPGNFHGPLYFYVLLFSEIFFGPAITGFRFVTGLLSLAGVFVIAQHMRFFGASARWATAALAVSAGSVFYSRYAIHESFFVLCQILFSYGYFLWLEERSRRALAWMGLGFFASIALKETFFLFFITWGVAIVSARVVGRLRGERLAEFEAPETEQGFWRQQANTSDVLIACILGVWFLLVIFTGFFLNQRGFHDMFVALAVWTKTGSAQSGHAKPFFYWLGLLWRYEWPALIGLAAALPLAWFLPYRQRIVAFTAFGTCLGYSLIPYKTPWLILNLLWPLALVFGMSIEWLSARVGSLAKGLALIAIATTAWSAYKLSFIDYSNEREAYVYVQSTKQMKAGVDLITEHVRNRPEDFNMKVMLLVRDPWPLPWIFGLYPNVVFGKVRDATMAGADVILVDGSDQGLTEAKLQGKYWRLPFQVRDSYEGGFVYLSYEKFRSSVPADTATVEPPGPADTPLPLFFEQKEAAP